MRYLIYLFLLVGLINLVSCDINRSAPIKYPQYSLTSYERVPDSNKVKMAEWITKTVEASTKHLTTSDYEDPEDVIEECTDQAKGIFEVTMYGLYRKDDFNTTHFIEQSAMTKSEKKILDSLINL